MLVLFASDREHCNWDTEAPFYWNDRNDSRLETHSARMAREFPSQKINLLTSGLDGSPPGEFSETILLRVLVNSTFLG